MTRTDHSARVVSLPFTDYRLVWRDGGVHLQRRAVDADHVGRWYAVRRWDWPPRRGETDE